VSRLAELLPLPPGLVAVTGDERTGKTTLLRALVGQRPDAIWLDLALPAHDDVAAVQLWAQLARRWPQWNALLQQELAEALDVAPHQDKKLFMLSTGSRRKVGLVALLASGATVTCLDQPFAALDLASARVVREFLLDMADHPARSWVVADYEADPRLPWRRQLSLP
jgi:ABC-type transport system involved in cytochrome c biogenesis ATPase subunit